MKVNACKPLENLSEIERIKKKALKDVNSYDENDPKPDYSNFECFLVGKVDGKAIATAAYRKPEGDVVKNLEIDDSTAELKNIHVLPNYRRNGYASKLVEEVESEAKSNRYNKMILRTTSLQDRAHQFYKFNGYKEIKREKPDYSDINYKLVFFRKNISNEK